MPAHGLDHGVAIDRRGKARPHSDDGRRHVARGAQVALSQNRVDHSRGFKLIEHLGLRVHHNGDVSSSVISSASAGVCAKRARMPSTSTSPKRMASQKLIVRRMHVGTAISAITTDTPARTKRAATPVAISPAREHKRAFPGHLPVLRFEQRKSGPTATLMIIYYHSIIRR